MSNEETVDMLDQLRDDYYKFVYITHTCISRRNDGWKDANIKLTDYPCKIKCTAYDGSRSTVPLPMFDSKGLILDFRRVLKEYHDSIIHDANSAAYSVVDILTRHVETTKLSNLSLDELKILIDEHVQLVTQINVDIEIQEKIDLVNKAANG